MVYEPAEDSFLIQKEVKRFARGKVLDMGTGSGILASTAAELKKVKSVIAVDIKKDTIDYCKEHVKNRKLSFLVSDLFSKVPKQKFDTIIFNPPYLPEQKGEEWELATEVAGGKHGYEIIGRFLAKVNDYLESDGVVLLLFSTVTGKMKVDALINDSMMEFEQLNKTNIAFEQLYVYRITKGRFRKQLEKKGVTNIAHLAKGHRGLIFTGMLKKKKITIKIQRSDIGAENTVDNEVKQLAVLNKHGIGPKLMFSGKDFFAYEYVPGDFILDYIAKQGVRRSDVIAVLKNVFEQMFTMDHLGLNKEEMHHPVKHIIVTPKGKVVLLDFERCKKRDKTHNVTQFGQFIISGRIIPHLQRHNIRINMLEMLNRSRKYSEKRTRENFESMVELVK